MTIGVNEIIAKVIFQEALKETTKPPHTVTTADMNNPS